MLSPLGALGGEIWVDRPGGLAHSGCCTYLPAETFLRMAILLLDDGTWQGRRLLPRGLCREMRKGTPQNPSFGLEHLAGRALSPAARLWRAGHGGAASAAQRALS